MKSKPMARPRFTARELEVLKFLYLKDEHAAAELHISLHTLRAHWRSINSKLGTHARKNAIVLFILSLDCPKILRVD
jgi:ATP/maltotriose-dependent transcriptional regulator MalT